MSWSRFTELELVLGGMFGLAKDSIEIQHPSPYFSETFVCNSFVAHVYIYIYYVIYRYTIHGVNIIYIYIYGVYLYSVHAHRVWQVHSLQWGSLLGLPKTTSPLTCTNPQVWRVLQCASSELPVTVFAQQHLGPQGNRGKSLQQPKQCLYWKVRK